jgi:hypothetical protein
MDRRTNRRPQAGHAGCQHISRKSRVPPAVADLIANLAGFGSAVE